MRAHRAIVCSLALGALVVPARAALPEGAVVVAKGATVDAAAVPTLFTIADGTYSALEVDARFQTTVHQATDLLVFEAGALFAHVHEPGSSPPVATAVYYFDPALNATLPVAAVPGAPSLEALTLRLPDGGEQTVSALLDIPGSAVLFLPEPGAALVLALGGLELAWLARRPALRKAGSVQGSRAGRWSRAATRSTAASP